MKVKKILSVLFIFVCLCLLILTGCTRNVVTVEFYVDGVLSYTYTIEKGGYIEDVPNVPKKEGMTGSWDAEDFDVVESNMRVNAIYKKDSYSITFIADGKTVTTVVIKNKSTLTEIPEVPAKQGYDGVWNITDFSVINKDTTVTAIYSSSRYSVKFSVNGEVYTERLVDSGNTLTDIPAVPAVDGHKYSGKWRYNKGTVEKPEWIDPVYTDITIGFTVEAYYFITVNLVDSNTRDSVFNLELQNEVASFGVGTKQNYAFYGWYSEQSYDNKLSFPCSFTDNTTVYARWVQTAQSIGFTFDGNKVTGYTGDDLDIIIPYKNGETVITEIAESAFENTDFSKISIPSTIEMIGDMAFKGNTVLSNIVFLDANNIKIVGEKAFYGCTALASYEFSSRLTKISNEAFYGCTLLSNLKKLADGRLETIGDRAFINVGNVSMIALPDTLKEIGESAFENLSTAEFSFAAANNIKKIGRYAFKNCLKMYSFDGEGLTDLGEKAFEGCKGLNTVSMLSTIPVYKLFGTDVSDSSKFYTVTIDEGSGNIDYYVPYSLRNVIIVGKKISDDIAVETLVPYALYNCYTVKTIKFCGTLSVIESNAFLMDTEESEDGRLTLNFPKGIVEIKENAFIGRNDLVSVSFPMSLKTIGERAFYGLSLLNTVNIEDNNALTFVGKEAFNDTLWFENGVGVIRLGRIALGISTNFSGDSLAVSDFSGVDTIAPYAFEGFTRLRFLTLGENILTIGDYAFKDCTNIETIMFPIKPTKEDSIGLGVFSGCRGLIGLTVRSSVNFDMLFGKLFYSGSHLRGEYYLPNTLTDLTLLCNGSRETEVASEILKDYKYIKNVTLGEGFITVCDGAFKNCIALKKIVFPSSVTAIGVSVRENGDEPAYDGVFVGSYALSEVVFAENSALEIIYSKAFQNTSLLKITIPKTVKLIGEYAFSGTNLAELVFADGDGAADILTIDAYAFSNINGFAATSSVVFPSRLNSLGEAAFYGCSTLRSVILNGNLNFIGNDCFKQCDLRRFELLSNVKTYITDEGSDVKQYILLGVLTGNANLEQLILYESIPMANLFFGGTIPTNLAELKVLGGEIISSQFENFTSLQHLTLSGITAIGDRAFYGCNNSAFRLITVPDTVMSIGDFAFAACTYVASVMFAGTPTITHVGDSAFEDDINLLQVNLPVCITDTEMNATFKNCLKLNETNIPLSVNKIGDDTFYNNSMLTAIEIPESVAEIGARAFKNCQRMEFESINFELLTTIGESAFENCYLLRGIKAKSIQNIGQNAFSGCTEMTEITIINEKVSYYLSDVTHIVTVNISDKCTALATDCFNGTTALQMAVVYSQNNNITLAVVESTFAKVFTINYDALPQATKEAYDGSLYPLIYSFTDAEFSYDEENMTATLISATCADDVVFLPMSTIKDGETYHLIGIANEVFKQNTFIQQIIIPYTIETIGNSAFQSCTNLTSVIFETGSNLEKIGDDCFYGCNALIKITLPNSLKTIGDRAFNGCSELVEVKTTYGGKLESIGEYAFQNTIKLNSFSINSELSLLGKGAFMSSGIISFYFGQAKLNEIKAYTFAYCTYLSLGEEDLPESITVVADTAFLK